MAPPARAVAIWRSQDAVPELHGDDVHVWLVDLDDDAGGDLFRSLSPAENVRAEAFRFPVHARRFAVGRARLREILAAYLDAEADAIELVEAPHGKPELAGPNAEALRFNLAHCEGLALYAVCLRDVGVDLELVERPRRPRWPEIAARFFHEDEQRALAGAEGKAGWVDFLRIWTLKEACLKAAGVGLLVDPRSFSVAEVLDGRAEAASVGGREWRCWEVGAAPGAVASVAASMAPNPRVASS